MSNLLEAIKNGDLEYCQGYIKMKKPLQLKELFEEPPLIIATKNKNWDIAFLLLKNRIDSNSVNSIGETSLMFAAKYNNVDMIKELIKFKADINLSSKFKGNALFYAVEGKSIEALDYLLSMGLDINAKDRYGKTVLSKAIEFNSQKLVDLVLYHDAIVRTRDLISAILRDENDILISLLKTGISVNSMDKKGNSLVLIAALEKKWELVRILYQFGAKAFTNSNTSLGWSILNDAAITQNMDLAKKIIDDLS